MFASLSDFLIFGYNLSFLTTAKQQITPFGRNSFGIYLTLCL